MKPSSKDPDNTGRYFIRFKNDVTIVQLENLFPALEKIYWYLDENSDALLKFQIGKEINNPGTYYSSSKKLF